LCLRSRGDEKTKKSIRDTIITTATDHIDTEKDQAIQDSFFQSQAFSKCKYK